MLKSAAAVRVFEHKPNVRSVAARVDMVGCNLPLQLPKHSQRQKRASRGFKRDSPSALVGVIYCSRFTGSTTQTSDVLVQSEQVLPAVRDYPPPSHSQCRLFNKRSFEADC